MTIKKFLSFTWLRRNKGASEIEQKTAQIAALEQQRERIYADVEVLERKEAELLARGKAAFVNGEKAVSRRLATQMHHLRQDIQSQHLIVNLINKKLTTLGTSKSLLTVASFGKALGFEEAELADYAARAEECVEEICSSAAAAAQMVSSMNLGDLEPVGFDGIMEEFSGVTATASAAEADHTVPADDFTRELEEEIAAHHPAQKPKLPKLPETT